ncbi:MAG: bifunctional riboflavin kinase/FAD synthetase [Solirubrobacterales bacterium]
MPGEIVTVDLDQIEPRDRSVAIGTFDGVHLGHRDVIEGFETVLTFEPHPLEVLKPEAAPKLLMPFEVKRDVLEGTGVREIVVIPFDRDFTQTTPEEFIERILVERLGAKSVSVGQNFRFGARAAGTPEMLAEREEFETRVVPLVEVDGETVSSTRIRALVASGEMGAAMDCLGSPFMMQGTVVEGDGRGRELGFPTANLVPDARLATPGHGVYAAFADGRPAAVNVGVRPTFDSGRGVLVEAHLIDVDEDLYGKELRVAFVERLRGERVYPGAEELIDQMKIDVEDARRVCGSFQRPSGA